MPVLAMLCACGDGHSKPDAAQMIDGAVDAPIDADSNHPMTLADTGLCANAGCTQIAPGIREYQPRWELWSDGATKRRWIYLPPNTQIDTSNMDYWQFPVGTKLWKEFTRDGVRVETRLVMRIGAANTSADWFYMPFVWNQTQDAAIAEKFGVVDANGTQHDVPTQQQCKQCHDGTQPSRVLGFSALQLDYQSGGVGSGVTLKTLVDENLLTSPPSAPTTPGDPYFPLPGNTTTEQPALGYLHANCGHCHNPNSKVYMDITPMVLRLPVGPFATVASTPAYQTTVNVTGMAQGNLTKIVVPGQPNQSILFYRFESTNPSVHMPLIGSEIMDPTGRTILRDWIANIQ
jgi:hypothetical protein